MRSKTFALVTIVVALFFGAMAPSPAVGLADEVKIEVGQRIKIKDPNGRMVSGTVKRVDKTQGQAEVEIYWQGRRRKAWMRFPELYDSQGWPIAVDPFKVGTVVEVLEQEKWIKAKVEEIRGKKIKVRLESTGTVRVVTESGIREIKVEKPPAPPDKGDGDGGKTGDGDGGGAETPDAGAIFNPATSEWKVSNVTHPKQLSELHLGMTVYIESYGEWFEGDIESLSATSCRVKDVKKRYDGSSWSAHPMKLSVTEPQTYRAFVRFTTPSPKRIVDLNGPTAKGQAIPPMEAPAAEAAPAVINLGPHSLPTETIATKSLSMNPWSSDYMLVTTERTRRDPNQRSSFMRSDDKYWRLDVVERKTGKTKFFCTIPPGWKAMSVSPSGTRIALRTLDSPFGRRGYSSYTSRSYASKQIMIIDATDPKNPKLSGFEAKSPAKTSRYSQHGFGESQFINDHLLMVTTQNPSALSLIDTKTGTQPWLIKSLSTFAMRPDGRLLAIFITGGVKFVEIPSGKVLYHESKVQAIPRCFSHDGARLVLGGGLATSIYDMARKQIVKTVATPSGTLTSLVGDYIVLSKSRVHSIDHHVPIWGIRVFRSDQIAFAGTTGWHLHRGKINNVIVPAPLDLELFDQLVSDRRAIANASVLRPGSRVRLDLRAGDEELRKRLEEQIADREWILDNRADVTISAFTERGESKTEKYEESRRFGFGHMGAPTGKTHSVRVRTNYARVTIQEVGEENPAWQTSSRSGGLSSYITLKEGESLQDRANEAAKGHLGLFGRVELPHHVMKPQYRNGIRMQYLTEHGLSELYEPKPPTKTKRN